MYSKSISEDFWQRRVRRTVTPGPNMGTGSLEQLHHGRLMLYRHRYLGYEIDS
jgi:hypothetical protein